MSNNAYTHYLSAMKKMRINYTLYAQKGFLSYFDLFSNPFNDLDFGSLPLSETSPPTFDPSSGFASLKQVTFDPDSPARENLVSLAQEIAAQAQKGAQVTGCKGVLVLFDALNPILDSIGATDLEMLEFVETLNEICKAVRQIKAKEEVKAKKPDSDDDYYDEDDDDDMAAMRARRGLPVKQSAPAKGKEEASGPTQIATLALTFNYDLFLTDKSRLVYDEFVKKHCDLLFETHSNKSGYSKDVDGTVEVSKIGSYSYVGKAKCRERGPSYYSKGEGQE